MKKIIILIGLSAVFAAQLHAGFWWNPAPPAAATASFTFGASYDEPAAEIVELKLFAGGAYLGSAFGSYGAAHMEGVAGGDTGEILLSAQLDSTVDEYDCGIDFLVNESTPPTVPGAPVVTASTPTTLSLMWSESTDNVGVSGYEIDCNQAVIASAGGPNATITGLQPGVPYSFRVRACDAAGNKSAWSGGTSVTLVAIPPAIAFQPRNLSVAAGQPAVFNVGATGDPLNFQWRKNGANIPGATASAYVVTNAQAADAADYSVVVSNFGGTATSVAANLTVSPSLPIIDRMPYSQSFYVGQPEPIVLLIEAHGTAPISYQWRKNGVDIPGATDSRYPIGVSDGSSAGSYTVVLSNGVGSVVTNPAEILRDAVPIRLALQYWQPNDYPNYPTYGYVDVWIAPHWVHWDEYYDETCNCTVPAHDELVDGYWESQWQQIGVLPDGLHGSTWVTTAGTFDINTTSSNFIPASPARGFLGYTYSRYQNVVMRAWARAPEGNCSSFIIKVYNPAGTLVSTSSINPNTGTDLSTMMANDGIWCVALEYGNAAGTSYTSGTVYYFIRAGIMQTTNVIGFAWIPNRNSSDPPYYLAASASSGLPVAFSMVSGPVEVAGNKATLLGYGAMTIRATQIGGWSNGTFWAAAAAVDRSFSAQGLSQSLTFPPVADHAYGDAPFALQGAASSGLAVNYAIVGPASVANGQLIIEGAGTVSVTASQLGNNIYLPATAITRTFSVAKATQVISFDPISDRTFGDAPINLTASASSGLPLKLALDSGPAVLLGRTVTITGTGTVAITASQAGNDNYYAATPVTRQFNVLADTTAPTAPTAVTGSEITGKSLRLSWNPSNDNIGVVRYDLFKGGVLVGQTAGLTAVIGGLSPQTGYQLGVRACDAAGNLSPTTTVTVTTAGNLGTDDGDGVPDSVESLLGTSPSAGGTTDSNDYLQFKIQRPQP